MKLFSLAVLFLFTVSCSTIINGTTQLVSINCNVSDADIYLDGVLIGKTPFSGSIPRSKKMLVVQKEGYTPFYLALSTSIEPVFFGNIITGGTLGSTTDFATGAAYSYSPSSFQVDLADTKASLDTFIKESNLRKFAMIHMSDIALDLANNDGHYLNTLLQLTDLSTNQQTIDLLKSFVKQANGKQVEFGQLVVSLI